jgi:predicted nucleic acid-binding protein
MILADTGPIVALFDRHDPDHAGCETFLRGVREPLLTTVPVLTEAFHLLSPGGRAAAALAQFVRRRGLRVHFLDEAALGRASELMDEYADRPMDLADASLVVAAEAHRCLTVWTSDRGDFAAYRARVGKVHKALSVVG